MIFMSHPQHGFMHVYTEAEVTANEKHGWTKIVSKEIPAVEMPSQNIASVVSEMNLTLSEQYEAKFGKKPHHKMSQKTIEAALKE